MKKARQQLNPTFKGRPQLIDRDKIVRAALEIGVDDLSMHSLAAHLEVSATALYRYFGSKEALIDACMDEFCSRLHLPAACLPWRDYMYGIGMAFRNALLALPGVCQYGFKIGPTTPAAFRIIESALQVLHDAGFAPADAWRAYSLVVDHAFYYTQKEELFHQLEAENGAGGYRVLQLAVEELQPFPMLASAIAAITPADFDGSYEQNLVILLDGLEQALHT